MVTPQWIEGSEILVVLSLVGALPMLWFRNRVPRLLRSAYVALVTLTVLFILPIIVLVLCLGLLHRSGVW